jgi:hypothetical protein
MRDLDLLTEFHILGGSSGYVNAKWYIRQLGYLVAEGIVEYAYYDTVTADLDRWNAIIVDAEKEAVETEGKLAQMADGAPTTVRDQVVADLLEARERARWARKEVKRRADERAKYDLPDGAKSAIVWHVKLTMMAQEVTAAQAVGGYRGKSKKDSSRDADPIGEEFPRETAITRGCRKVMLALAHVAPKLREKIDRAEKAAQEVAEQYPELREAGRAELRQLHAVPAVRDVSVDEYAGGSRGPGSDR